MNTLDVEPSGEAFVSGGDDGLVKVRCGDKLGIFRFFCFFGLSTRNEVSQSQS